jgi:hypothetical protein
MKSVTGIAIVTDTPDSPAAAIAKRAEDISMIWRYWDIGRIKARSYHGTNFSIR